MGPLGVLLAPFCAFLAQLFIVLAPLGRFGSTLGVVFSNFAPFGLYLGAFWATSLVLGAEICQNTAKLQPRGELFIEMLGLKAPTRSKGPNLGRRNREA